LSSTQLEGGDYEYVVFSEFKYYSQAKGIVLTVVMKVRKNKPFCLATIYAQTAANKEKTVNVF